MFNQLFLIDLDLQSEDGHGDREETHLSAFLRNGRTQPEQPYAGHRYRLGGHKA